MNELKVNIIQEKLNLYMRYLIIISNDFNNFFFF